MAKRVSLKGKGAELFFGDYPASEAAPPGERTEAGAPERPASEPDQEPRPQEAVAGPVPPAGRAPRQRPSPAENRSSSTSKSPGNDAGTPDRLLGNREPQEIEAIRRVVKAPGREVSFVRLTPQEKGRLAEVVYAYRRRGVKTTENEINRIAINALLADYQANGEQSTLARVLEALQA